MKTFDTETWNRYWKEVCDLEKDTILSIADLEEKMSNGSMVKNH